MQAFIETWTKRTNYAIILQSRMEKNNNFLTVGPLSQATSGQKLWKFVYIPAKQFRTHFNLT